MVFTKHSWPPLGVIGNKIGIKKPFGPVKKRGGAVDLHSFETQRLNFSIPKKVWEGLILSSNKRQGELAHDRFSVTACFLDIFGYNLAKYPYERIID